MIRVALRYKGFGKAEVGSMRIGCGAGFSSDRLEPAIDLAWRGKLDWLIFETIGKRTMACGHRDRVNTSLYLDSHGKSWSYLLLRLAIEVPDN